MRYIVVFLLFSVTVSFGQQPKSHKESAHLSIGMGGSANADDVNLGLDVGLGKMYNPLLTYLAFDIRPYQKKILIHDQGNQYFQFAERRYYLGAGTSYFLDISSDRFGVYADLGVSYTWGSYGGTKRDAPNGFILIPGTGLYWRSSAQYFLVKGGYEHLNTKSLISGHRLNVVLIINFVKP